MAHWSLFGTIVSVLSVFKITPPVDDQGHTVDLTGEVSPGVLSYALPFQSIY